tara:strand:+ start:68 stop:559 length:492 start_codon:yes stop_codon:yes gene_type:complete
MDIFFVIIGIILCFVGIIGSFIPLIPGPITSFSGLLFLHLTTFVPFDFYFIIGCFTIAISVFMLDLIIPIIGLKKLGGTKKGLIGATIGLLLGFFIGPIGLISGPFIGALSGELLNKNGIKKSIKASLGTLIGFLAGVAMKFLVSFVFTILFFKILLTSGGYF